MRNVLTNNWCMNCMFINVRMKAREPMDSKEIWATVKMATSNTTIPTEQSEREKKAPRNMGKGYEKICSRYFID